MSHSGFKWFQDFKEIWLVSISPFSSFTPSRLSYPVNITTPPAVVMSLKSLAGYSPVSPPTSASDTESPPPVTPPDSQTVEPHAPIVGKPISRRNNVSILDFDLNNLLLMGDSKCDDDDDDLSGLELVYPDDVC